MKTFRVDISTSMRKHTVKADECHVDETGALTFYVTGKGLIAAFSASIWTQVEERLPRRSKLRVVKDGGEV